MLEQPGGGLGERQHGVSAFAQQAEARAEPLGGDEEGGVPAVLVLERDAVIAEDDEARTAPLAARDQGGEAAPPDWMQHPPLGRLEEGAPIHGERWLPLGRGSTPDPLESLVEDRVGLGGGAPNSTSGTSTASSGSSPFSWIGSPAGVRNQALVMSIAGAVGQPDESSAAPARPCVRSPMSSARLLPAEGRREELRGARRAVVHEDGRRAARSRRRRCRRRSPRGRAPLVSLYSSVPDATNSRAAAMPDVERSLGRVAHVDHQPRGAGLRQLRRPRGDRPRGTPGPNAGTRT